MAMSQAEWNDVMAKVNETMAQTTDAAARFAARLLKRFIVIGPPRTYIERLLDDGSGPMSTEHDVYLVDACTVNGAKWAAFRLAKSEGHQWYTDLCDEHPLKAVRVELTPDEDPADWPGLYVKTDR